MSKYTKIYPVSFGFAWGVIAGLGWMLLAWAGARWGFGLPVLNVMSHVHRGLAPTLFGGLWGFFWGFLDCFIFGLLVAIIYNCCTKCFCPAGDSCCE